MPRSSRRSKTPPKNRTKRRNQAKQSVSKKVKKVKSKSTKFQDVGINQKIWNQKCTTSRQRVWLVARCLFAVLVGILFLVPTLYILPFCYKWNEWTLDIFILGSQQGFCENKSYPVFETVLSVSLVILFQFFVVIFNSASMLLKNRHGDLYDKNYVTSCCKYRCKRNRDDEAGEVNEADDEVDDDDNNDGNTRPKQLWQRVRRSALFDFKNHDIGTPKRVISTQNHLSKVVAILRTSTLFIMAYLFADDIIFAAGSGRQGGVIVAWNNMLVHTLIIPFCFVWVGSILSTIAKLSDLYALHLRARQHCISFFFFIAMAPICTVILLTSMLSIFSLTTEISGSGPKLIVGLTALRLIYNLFVHSLERYVQHGELDDLEVSMDSNDVTDTNDDTDTTTEDSLREQFLESNDIFWWMARLMVIGFCLIVDLPTKILSNLLKCCQCCIGRCLPPTKAINFLCIRLPFTYNFIQLTAIYGIGLFNIMFHLLASTTVQDEPWSTTLLKYLIFFCVGYNFLPVLFQLVAIAHDSWNDFPYLGSRSMELLKSVEKFIDGRLKTGVKKKNPKSQLQEQNKKQIQTTMASQNDTESRMYYKLPSIEYKKVFLDDSAFGFIHQSMSTIVWIFVLLFASVALLARLNINNNKIMSVVQHDSNSLYIDHSIGGIHLFKKNDTTMMNRTECQPPYVCNSNSQNQCTNIDMDKEQCITRENHPARFEKYGICRHKYHELSVLDYSLLSNMVYYLYDEKNTKHFPTDALQNIQTVLDFTFPKNLYNVTMVNDTFNNELPNTTTLKECYGPNVYRDASGKADGDTSPSPPMDCRKCKEFGSSNGVKRFEQFLDFRFHNKKVAVIAIKGTSPLELLDIIADVRLWSESVLLQTASSFLPTLSLMSPGMIKMVIQGIQQTQNFFTILNTDLDFHNNIVRYIHCIHSQLPKGWSVAVTGHSLGGGLSTIVGATLDIQSIAFSPPGFVKSRGKFTDPVLRDKTNEHGRIVSFNHTSYYSVKKRPRLNKASGKSLNIIPTRDLVPMADLHFGLTQDVLCMQSNPLTCHQLERTVCDLLRRCGDDHDGARFSSCQFDNGDKKFQKVLNKKLTDYGIIDYVERFKEYFGMLD